MNAHEDLEVRGFKAEFHEESGDEWAVGEADSFPTAVTREAVSFPYNLP